jgi:hypothetical protein
MSNTPVGFDLGNGTTAISIHGKVSKVPSGYAEIEPQGPIGKNNTHIKPKAFSILSADKLLWFDQDVLSVRLNRELDHGKYNVDYIRAMFSGVMAKAAIQHKLNTDAIGPMNVVCSMPPESWQNASHRKVAEAAYRKVFNARLPWFIRGEKFDTFRINTQFGGIVPEAMSYGKAFGLKPDFTIISDIGSGTVDYVVFRTDPENPLIVKSINDGLLHAYDEIGGVNNRDIELGLIRGNNRDSLSSYFSDIKHQLTKICRKLDTGSKRINLVLIGGGCKLMTPDVKSSFRQSFGNILIKDEFVNVRANARLAV